MSDSLERQVVCVRYFGKAGWLCVADRGRIEERIEQAGGIVQKRQSESVKRADCGMVDYVWRGDDVGIAGEGVSAMDASGSARRGKVRVKLNNLVFW